MPIDAPFDFGAFPTLGSDHLVLRELAEADAANVFVFWGDPVVQQYNGARLQNLREAHLFIADIRSGYMARKKVTWAIAPRGHETVLGEVSIFNWNRRHHRAEISYALARASWGQGIASEAVRAVLRFGFARMLLHRIEAVTLVNNARSVRLLERLGFVREGTRREYSLDEDGACLDSAIYGLLEGENGA